MAYTVQFLRALIVRIVDNPSERNVSKKNRQKGGRIYVGSRRWSSRGFVCIRGPAGGQKEERREEGYVDRG